MKRKLFLLFSFLLLSVVVCAQLTYPIVGQYKKKSAQGMAIFGDQAYLFNDGGLCRVVNLESSILEKEFMLGSAAKQTHVNSACFSRQYIEGDSVPALYIAEFYGKRRCFVEVVDGDSCRLVQTIEYKNQQGKNPFVREWLVDNDENMLYAVIREGNKQDKNLIKKFSLPKLNEGSVILLTEKDVIDSFTVNFLNGLQGGIIKDHYMYIVTGFTAIHGVGPYFDRAIKVIDLKRKKLVKSIDLTKVTMNEPEDIDFYNGKCLLFVGGTGGIYEVF